MRTQACFRNITHDGNDPQARHAKSWSPLTSKFSGKLKSISRMHKHIHRYAVRMFVILRLGLGSEIWPPTRYVLNYMYDVTFLSFLICSSTISCWEMFHFAIRGWLETRNLRELSQPQERFPPKFKRNQEKCFFWGLHFSKKFEVVFNFNFYSNF